MGDVIGEMVNRFLSWPLPDDVCVDAVACQKGAQHRTGTNLLTHAQARQMIEHVCAAALAAKDAEIEALKLSLVRAAGWTEHDQPLPEDDAILAAFPVGTNRDAGRFATYAEAQRLVSAKRSKGALVDLVNWLLARAERAEAEAAGLRADAGRYRVARAKVCIVGDAFHVINLRPTYVAPDAAIEFDAAIDAARGG